MNILTHLINTEEFTRKQLMDIAYSLGFRERYKIFRDNPDKPLTEKRALIKCMETFVEHSPADFSSKDLSVVLFKAGLDDIAKTIVVKITTRNTDDKNPRDETSGVTMDPIEPYQMSVLDIAYPLITLMLTATMMTLLMRDVIQSLIFMK